MSEIILKASNLEFGDFPVPTRSKVDGMRKTKVDEE
jgi:hypothetical protein